MRSFVVLNPEAGGGKDRGVRREALAGLPGAEVHVSESSDDATSAAREAVEAGSDLVVAAGGDGTVHAVLNGIAPRFDATRFAVAPLGTANDFVRSLALPDDVEAVVEAVRGGRTRALDVVEVRPRGDGGDRQEPLYCGNVAAGGFAGEVGEGIGEDVKARWGPLSYLRVAAETLGELEVWPTALDPGGEGGTRELLNVVVANGRYAGGGVAVAPDADPADGLLDLVWIESMSAADLALLAPRIAAGEHAGADGVGTRRTRSVRVRAEREMPFSLDGERYAFRDVEFRVRRGALRTVVAPGDD